MCNVYENGTNKRSLLITGHHKLTGWVNVQRAHSFMPFFCCLSLKKKIAHIFHICVCIYMCMSNICCYIQQHILLILQYECILKYILQYGFKPTPRKRKCIIYHLTFIWSLKHHLSYSQLQHVAFSDISLVIKSHQREKNMALNILR